MAVCKKCDRNPIVTKKKLERKLFVEKVNFFLYTLVLRLVKCVCKIRIDSKYEPRILYFVNVENTDYSLIY